MVRLIENVEFNGVPICNSMYNSLSSNFIKNGTTLIDYSSDRTERSP